MIPFKEKKLKTFKQIKLAAIASVVLLAGGLSSTAMAQNGYAPVAPHAAPVPAPMPPARGYFPGNAPYGYNRGFNRGPWNAGPWGGNRWGNNRMPWGNGGMPWGGRNGWGRTPFESNFTPWSNRFWNDLGKGGRNPFRNADDWFRPGPKDGLANMWDDLLNAPSEMGRMPGGWTAPSISVPNPIDVGDEFGDAMQDMPHEIRNQMDNIDIQTW